METSEPTITSIASEIASISKPAASEAGTTKSSEPASPQRENARKAEGEPKKEPKVNEVETEGEIVDERPFEANDPEIESEEVTEDDNEEESEAEEAPEKGDKQSEDEAPENVTVTLKDGTKVSLSELQDGYFRQQDYSRKTAELAQVRQQEEARVQQLEGRYLGALEKLNSQIEASNPLATLQAQWEQAESIGDIEQANRIELRMIRAKEQMAELAAERSRVAEKQQAAQTQYIQQKMNEEREKLSSAIPGFSDPAKRGEIQTQIASAMLAHGYEEQEIGMLGDARLVQMVYKAAQYDKMMSKKPEVASSLKGKAITPKAGGRPSGSEGRKQTAINDFSKKPSVDGLASLFKQNRI